MRKLSAARRELRHLQLKIEQAVLGVSELALHLKNLHDQSLTLNLDDFTGKFDFPSRNELVADLRAVEQMTDEAGKLEKALSDLGLPL